MYCAAGNISSALDTIRQFTMADPRLELNMVSFTALINGVFHFPSPTSRMIDDFAKRIDHVMALIERRELRLDDIFFSCLLKTVAKKTDFNTATAVLEHAHRQLGLHVCVHTTTVFLQHAFKVARDQPTREEEIVQVVLKLALQIGHHGDSTFWNQMVIGFARLGRLDLMTRFLARLRSYGQVASWFTLFTSLKAALKHQHVPALETVLTEAQYTANAGGGEVGPLPAHDTMARQDFVKLFQEIEVFLTEMSDATQICNA
jgi:hypothetical protein